MKFQILIGAKHFPIEVCRTNHNLWAHVIIKSLKDAGFINPRTEPPLKSARKRKPKERK